MTKQTQAKSATKAAKAPAPKAKADASKVVLAPVTPLAARKAADTLVQAAVNRESADGTFLDRVKAAAKLIKSPLTAAQYERQVAPQVKAAFAEFGKRMPETSQASYRSRFKTLMLALCSGLPELQPQRGEGYTAYLSRASQALVSAKLKSGEPVYAADVKRAGRAAGTKVKPQGGANGGPTASPQAAPDTSKRDAGETGMDMRPKLAAAMILMDQNAATAGKLALAVEHYRERLVKFLDALAAEHAQTLAAEKPKAETALGAAMNKAAQARKAAVA